MSFNRSILWQPILVGMITIVTILTTISPTYQVELKRLSINATTQNRPEINKTYHWPLSFEANVGQSDDEIKFIARGHVFIT